MNFNDLMYFECKRKTKREAFLEAMETVVPFEKWTSVIEPFYYADNAGKRGRPPIGIDKMLRMYLLQVWFNLSDELLEDNIYESNSFQRFVGIDLMSESVPDATTLLKFRHMLTENKLQQQMMAELTALLKQNNILMTQGTLVDATIVQASSSTKNKNKERDPFMKSTQKGKVWHFGGKAHIGTDKNGIVHTVITTPANIHDSTPALDLLHGEEEEVFGDSGYVGMDKKENAPKNVKFQIVKRLSTVNKIQNDQEREIVKLAEKAKCSIRAKVEHAFHIIKNIFGFRRFRYKGHSKNDSLLHMLFASCNLYKLRNTGRSLGYCSSS